MEDYSIDFNYEYYQPIDPKIDALIHKLLSWEQAGIVLDGVDVLNMLVDLGVCTKEQAQIAYDNSRLHHTVPELPTRHFQNVKGR